MLPFAFAAAALAPPPRETGARETGAREAGAREAGAREAGAREAGAREAGLRDFAAEPREAALVTLQVSGGKPIRLRGTLVAEANSWAPGTIAWHEVAAWRCDGREIAVAVRTLLKAPGTADVHRAEVFPTLGEAQAWLEEFDPIADIAVDLDASDRRVSAVEIALRAAALRGRADAVTRQWRALLGEILLRLDHAP